MSLRRGVTQLLPRLLQHELAASSALPRNFSIPSDDESGSSIPQRPSFGTFRSFASDSVAKTGPSSVVTASELSMSPTSKITRPFAYFVLTGGRFLYASAIRLVVLKGLLSLGAAADTLAMASLEVDLSSLEEGSTIVVKWRGKPVFIKYRSEEDIAAQTSVAMTVLKDPQSDVERAVDPKYLILVGICTHLGCVPIAGAGNYAGGWFCPCHGSHYDGSGRIREGPAPYNLEIPEYKYMGDNKLIIG
eukprot:gene13246-19082_t